VNEKRKTEKQANHQKPDSGFFSGLFRWKLTDEELKYQIENYETLGFWGSSRGVAALFLGFSSIIGLIYFPVTGWLGLLTLLLAYFIYRGQKWAMVLTMIVWTLDKFVSIIMGFSIQDYGGPNAVALIFWWAVFMGQFWKAYQVEKEKPQFNKVTDKEISERKDIEVNKEFYDLLKQDPQWSRINKVFLAELSTRFDNRKEVEDFIELTGPSNFERDIIPLTLDSSKKETGVDMLAFELQIIGCSLIQLNKCNEGIKSLKLALRIYPAFTSSYGPLALAYYDKGEYQKALKYSTKWLNSPITGSNDMEGYNPIFSDRMRRLNTGQQRNRLEELKRRLNMIRNDCLERLSKK